MMKKSRNRKCKRRVWSNQKGSGVPLSVAMVCVVVLLFCLISEYIRLQIIVSGVRDAVEDAVISAFPFTQILDQLLNGPPNMMT